MAPPTRSRAASTPRPDTRAYSRSPQARSTSARRGRASEARVATAEARSERRPGPSRPSPSASATSSAGVRALSATDMLREQSTSTATAHRSSVVFGRNTAGLSSAAASASIPMARSAGRPQRQCDGSPFTCGGYNHASAASATTAATTATGHDRGEFQRTSLSMGTPGLYTTGRGRGVRGRVRDRGSGFRKSESPTAQTGREGEAPPDPFYASRRGGFSRQSCAVQALEESNRRPPRRLASSARTDGTSAAKAVPTRTQPAMHV